jgi:parallel beta-helix repeat protein
MEKWARNGSLLVMLFVILSSFSVSIVVIPENAGATTLYVGGIGPNNYTAIRDAIENASIGNTVFVFNGIYKEQVLVDKTVTLVGEDVDATLIEVNSTGRGMYVVADWVNISGFTFVAKPWPPTSTPIIFGVELYQSSNCTIVNNKFQTNKKGIYLVESSYNLVADNYAINNWDSIFLLDSDYNVVLNNTAYSSNENGIHLTASHHNVIAGNNASGNGGDGIHLFSSNDNTIFHNYVFGNLGPSFDDGENCWDNCYPSGGNYWDVYSGTDTMSGSDQDVPGSDGIGDIAFDIPGGTNQDRYPLMSPVYFPSAPSPPERIQAVAGDQHVNLTWDPPLFDGFSTITGYSIYREDTTGTEILLATLGIAFEYSDAGLANGEMYTYRVSANNSLGEGCKSDDAIVIPATLPGPPTGLIADAGIEEITLVWSPPADDGGLTITNYLLYRGLTSGGETFLRTHGTVTIHTDSGLTSGQDYFYKVSAVNGIGEGPKSNEASANPLVPPPNQSPTCFIESPISGEVVFGSYQIGGRSDDSDGIVERVEVRIDNGSWALALGTEFWAFAWNTSQFANGQHTIHARSFDGSNYSDEVNVTMIIDNFVRDGNGEYPVWLMLILVIVIIMASIAGYLLTVWVIRSRKDELLESPEESPEPEERRDELQ